jgi:hypothetical protein
MRRPQWEPIKTLIQEAEKAKKYEAGSLVVTKDDARVYASTNPETLGFYSSGELGACRVVLVEGAPELTRIRVHLQSATGATSTRRTSGGKRLSASSRTSSTPRQRQPQLLPSVPAARRPRPSHRRRPSHVWAEPRSSDKPSLMAAPPPPSSRPRSLTTAATRTAAGRQSRQRSR